MMFLLEVALWGVAALMFLAVTGTVFFQSVPGAAACVALAGLLIYVVAV